MRVTTIYFCLVFSYLVPINKSKNVSLSKVASKFPSLSLPLRHITSFPTEDYMGLTSDNRVSSTSVRLTFVRRMRYPISSYKPKETNHDFNRHLGF